ncbi:MAG TPA: putative motility protein [Rhodopseudomonas sp.]|uniref:putative motility protein n=1 Tax=Rhodopseudomonas sp. TaxID=1078 RepID=UPI002EDB8B6E
MDTVSMVGSLLALQAGGLQTQVATAIVKSNMDAEASAVTTLLGAAQQNLSLANVGAGVGGNLNIAA